MIDILTFIALILSILCLLGCFGVLIYIVRDMWKNGGF